MTFDMFKARQELTKAGIDEKHAEAFVSMTRNAMEDGVATKSDIAELKGVLKTDIAEFKGEFKTDIAELKISIERLETAIERNHSKTIMAVFGIMATLTIITFTAIKFFPSLTSGTP